MYKSHLGRHCFMAVFVTLLLECQSIPQPKFNLRPSTSGRKPAPIEKHTPVPAKPSQYSLDTVPITTAAYKGQDAFFECSAPPNSNLRIQWWEWNSSPTKQPQLISDRDIVQVHHPYADKYEIHQPDNDTFILVIHDVQASDIGTYTCLDAGYGPPCSNISDNQRGNIASAELIMLSSEPNCDTSVSSKGIALEDDYESAECMIYFQGSQAPVITWTGPQGYTVQYETWENFVWSGIEMTVSRLMNGQHFTTLSQFSDSDSRTHASKSKRIIPPWTFEFSTPSLQVSWARKNFFYAPNDDKYFVGESIICYADANPTANISWQNMQTGEVFNTDTFSVTNSLLGKTCVLRCQARNVIDGKTYISYTSANATVIGNNSYLLLRNDVSGSNSYYFNRSWAEYQQPFGDLPSQLYWAGLNRLSNF